MATRRKGGEQGRKAAGTAARPRARGAVARDLDTEARILEAARRVFARRGSAGARMQEIAEEAGVNQALLHYYFRSKDGLALAVFREAAGKLFPGVLRILSGDGTLEQRIEQVVHHYIDTLREHPYLPGYVLGELNFNPGRIAALGTQIATGGDPTQLPRALARLEQELAAHAAAGALRPMAARQFLANLASLCVFPFAARPMIAALLQLDDRQWHAFLDERRAELPRFILNALRP